MKILKYVSKKPFLFLDTSSPQHGQSEIFGKGYEVICIENINILKNVAIGTF